MGKGYSLVVVEGSLGRDPEAKSTPNGTKVTTFSLGFERGFGDKARTCWVDCVAFKELADFSEKFLKKGKAVRVIGELDVRSWDDKESGRKRYKTEIVADKIQFVDSGSGGSRSESSTRQSSTPARQAAAPATRQQTAPQTRAEADPFADPEEEPF
jgi:single-strand DNA-binding protein